jgi:acyl carrier protein
MLTLDADLEGELGIDTVKQLAIVSEVRKTLGLEVDPRFKLRDFRTLRALCDHLASRNASTESAPACVPSSLELPLGADAFAQVAPSLHRLRPGRFLAERAGPLRAFEVHDLWLATSPLPHARVTVSAEPASSGQRLRVREGHQALLECVCLEREATLSAESHADDVAFSGPPPGASSSILGLTRLDPDHYSCAVDLGTSDDLGQKIDALIDSTFECAGLCWLEAHGEKTFTLRAQSVRLSPDLVNAKRVTVEVELSSAQAGRSRARASVRNEHGAAVAVMTGLEGAWPDAAGSSLVERDSWQALRTAVRGEARK